MFTPFSALNQERANVLDAITAEKALVNSLQSEREALEDSIKGLKANQLAEAALLKSAQQQSK